MVGGPVGGNAYDMALRTVFSRSLSDPGEDVPGICRVVDNSVEPALRVESGTTVSFECPGLPLPERASVPDQFRIDPERPHTIMGDEFEAPYVHDFTWEPGALDTELREGVQIPIRPFCGVMGVPPAAVGQHPTTPPGRAGGNLDLRQLVPGSRLRLPVEVDGAMFYAGDGHAAQGDGEVCLTAIETAVRATLRVWIDREHTVQTPEFGTPAESGATTDSQGWYVTSGIGPDLYACSQDASRRMIDYLGTHHGLSREEAYVLCSGAVDLRLGEVVDAPNFIVTAHLPMSLFTDNHDASGVGSQL